MFPWNSTPHQTNGAVSNYFGVGGQSSTVTSVPVAAAHSVGATGGFTPAAQFASPMVGMHDTLGRDLFSPMPSRVPQVRATRRPRAVFSAPSPAPTFAATGYSFGGGSTIPLEQRQEGWIFVHGYPERVPHSVRALV